jgi:voltage-gated potassium channel Kch
MLKQIPYTALLVAASVLIHATVLTWLFRRSTGWPALGSSSFFLSTWRMVFVAWWIILAHLAVILVWAIFYVSMGVVADLPAAGYFSIVTYTTVGYGDVLPSQQWRLLAGVEALTGILMSGWSAAFFFSIANTWHSRSHTAGTKSED